SVLQIAFILEYLPIQEYHQKIEAKFTKINGHAITSPKNQEIADLYNSYVAVLNHVAQYPTLKYTGNASTVQVETTHYEVTDTNELTVRQKYRDITQNPEFSKKVDPTLQTIQNISSDKLDDTHFTINKVSLKCGVAIFTERNDPKIG